jgi:hypothetical protein
MQPSVAVAGDVLGFERVGVMVKVPYRSMESGASQLIHAPLMKRPLKNWPMEWR